MVQKAKIPKANDFLQCGCRKVTPVEGSANNTVRMERCECTIQNKEGFVKDKKGIVTLKFGAMAAGEDPSL